MKQILSLILIAIFFASCSTAKMSVSEELKASHDEYKVKGRQGILIKQKLSFGEFSTSQVKRSWTKGSSLKFGIVSGGTSPEDWVNLISMEYIKRKQTVRFELTDGKLGSAVYCVSRFNARDLEIGKTNSILNIGMDVLGIGGSSESTYYVQIFDKQDSRPWEMVIDNQAAQAKAKTYIGYLAKGRDEYYSIVPVRRMENSKGKSGNILAGSIGFEFRDKNDRPVAAVSMIDKGMVFLGKTTREERFLMANASAALLLQQEIE